MPGKEKKVSGLLLPSAGTLPTPKKATCKRCLPFQSRRQGRFAVFTPPDDPKIHSPITDEDEFLAHGPKALFIENPHDQSNRPADLKVTIRDFGSHPEKLFLRAFVDGLHNPQERPTCPHCGKTIPKNETLHLRLKQPIDGRIGQWRPAGEINLYDKMPLCLWHFWANNSPHALLMEVVKA